MGTFLFPFRPTTAQNRGAIPNLEEALVNGLKAKNKVAIEQLYQMYAAALFGIITRIVKHDEVAEDVLQDTFLKIWKHIDQYDPSKGRLFTWVANLAKNAAIDHTRSKQYVNSVKTDDINNLSPDLLKFQKYAQLNVESIGLRQLTLNLKPNQQQIIELIYYKGYTHLEVSEKLNIPLGTVKTRIRLAIICLRQYFNETNQQLSQIPA